MQVISNPAARINDVGCRRGPGPVRPGLVIENLTEFDSCGSAPYCVTVADYERDHLA
jgi:hypothetical protein